MLISDSHKLILMLPQKCGSSTLQTRLKTIHDLPEFGGLPYYNEELGKLISKHITAKEASRLTAYQNRSHYLKACFVRSPYDRNYSWFNWLVKTNREQLEKISMATADATLSEQQEFVYQRQVKHALRIKKRLEEADYDFNRFIQLKPARFKLISKFTHLRNKCQIDFIGRVENFEEDFAALCEKIGFKPTINTNANVLTQTAKGTNTQIPQYLDKYTSETIRITNKTFAKDFKYFNYTKIAPRSLRSKI